MRLWRNHTYGGPALSYTQIFCFMKCQCPEHTYKHTHTALLKCQMYFKYPLTLCYCVSVVDLVFLGRAHFSGHYAGVWGGRWERDTAGFCCAAECQTVLMQNRLCSSQLKETFFSCLINFAFVVFFFFFLHHVLKCSARKIRKCKQMEKRVPYLHQ